MYYSFNCLPILIIVMFLKISYDLLDLEYVGVDLKSTTNLYNLF